MINEYFDEFNFLVIILFICFMMLLFLAVLALNHKYKRMQVEANPALAALLEPEDPSCPTKTAPIPTRNIMYP